MSSYMWGIKQKDYILSELGHSFNKGGGGGGEEYCIWKVNISFTDPFSEVKVRFYGF